MSDWINPKEALPALGQRVNIRYSTSRKESFRPATYDHKGVVPAFFIYPTHCVLPEHVIAWQPSTVQSDSAVLSEIADLLIANKTRPQPALNKVCSVDGCQDSARSLGMCSIHYHRAHYRKLRGLPDVLEEEKPKKRSYHLSPAGRERLSSKMKEFQQNIKEKLLVTDPKAMPENFCLIDECEGRAFSRGMCSKHYQREYHRNRRGEMTK